VKLESLYITTLLAHKRSNNYICRDDQVKSDGGTYKIF